MQYKCSFQVYIVHGISHTLYHTSRPILHTYITPLDLYRIPNITPLDLYRIPYIKPLDLYRIPYIVPLYRTYLSMVKIYDIMNMICSNLCHMLYQPSTYISTRAGGPLLDIGVLGWYRMRYRFWHVIFSIRIKTSCKYTAMWDQTYL